jgi:branched-chain amino acid transport system substrate-binding protein
MLLPNTVLQHRYTIVSQIAQGGGGTVYAAQDMRLHIRVAIKELLLSDLQAIKDFEREAQLLAHLRHSALPRVIDHFTEGTNHFLVMDFIDGDDLATTLQHQGHPFSIADVLKWMEDLLDAVTYLHTQHPPIFHRDIKPGNLKVGPQNKLMLLDFGLAKGSLATQVLTIPNSIRGYTLHYAPLEQIQGTGTDERSDLYALGATIYHLITGVMPADALTRVAAIIRGDPDPLVPPHQQRPGVPLRLSQLLLTCLALNPAQRYASAPQVTRDLQDLVQSSSIAHTLTSAGEPTIRISPASGVPGPPPPAQRTTSGQSSWKLFLLIGGIIAVLGFGAWRLLGERLPSEPTTDAGGSPTAAAAGGNDLQPSARSNPPDEPTTDAGGSPTAAAAGGNDLQPSPRSNPPESTVTATRGAIAAPPPASITIVSSFPRTGSSRGQTDSIVNAIKMRLEEDKNTICDGTVQVKYEDLDDASAIKGSWDEAKEVENANLAAGNKDSMVYIGTFNSGAAKLSIPILNQANLVMISPANTYPGLTKSGKGIAGEPDIYYPTGTRNYTRVVPADDVQGFVAANWARDLGATRVYILDDNDLYGTQTADLFEATATANGMVVLGRESIDPRARDYASLMTRIKATNPDLIYFGGITRNNAAQVIKDIRAVGMRSDSVKFMAPDGIFEQAFIDAAGVENSENTYITFGGVLPDKLEGKGKTWYNAYKARFGSEPEAYATYGYEATSVALAALNMSCDNLTRENVFKNVVSTKDFNGVLGTWSFDANGDTTLTTMSGMQIHNGQFEFVSVLSSK